MAKEYSGHTILIVHENTHETFSPMHLVFLKLNTHRQHLDFKILDEKHNEVIPRTLYLQLLNKQ